MYRKHGKFCSPQIGSLKLPNHWKWTPYTLCTVGVFWCREQSQQEELKKETTRPAIDTRALNSSG